MRSWTHVSCLALASVWLACGSPPQEPVAEVSIDQEQLVLPYGHSRAFELRWKMLAPLEGINGDPLVFLHLLDDEGEVALTLDHPFPSSWQPGETVTDPLRFYHSFLAEALPAGDYRLTVGLYRGSHRFTLLGGVEVARQEYEIGQVVIPSSAEAPAYTFSETWGDVQLGSDRQVFGRRWLRDDGSMEVTRLSNPGQLWMSVRLPWAEEGQELVLEEGEHSPWLRLTNSCGEGQAEAVGPGTHGVSLELPASEGPCVVHFDTNFQLVDRRRALRSSIILEQLAWEQDL